MPAPALPPPFTDVDRYLAAVVHGLHVLAGEVKGLRADLAAGAEPEPPADGTVRLTEPAAAAGGALPRTAGPPVTGEAGTDPLVEPAAPRGPGAPTGGGEWPKAIGGPWWELSDGSKVRGREDAAEAQADLDRGA